jgi:hypothetical protein
MKMLSTMSLGLLSCALLSVGLARVAQKFEPLSRVVGSRLPSAADDPGLSCLPCPLALPKS